MNWGFYVFCFIVLILAIIASADHVKSMSLWSNKHSKNLETDEVSEGRTKLIPLCPEQFEKAQYCRQIAQLSIINTELKEQVEKQAQEIWELKKELEK